MKARILCVLVLVALLAGCAALSAWAADLPRWYLRTPDGSLVVATKEELGEAWSACPADYQISPNNAEEGMEQAQIDYAYYTCMANRGFVRSSPSQVKTLGSKAASP